MSSQCGFTTSLEQSQLNWLAGTSFPAAPANAYLALFSGLPKKDGTGATEVTGTRTAITWSAPAQDGGGHQFITNSGSITQTIANACYIIGFGVYSASTGGTLYFFDKLNGIQVQNANQSLVIPANTINVYLTRNE